MRKLIGQMVIVCMGVLALAGCGQGDEGSAKGNGKSGLSGELTVYTAIEEELIPTYLESFEKQYPNIDLNIVRDSTGIITSKLLAEGENTKADVVWGLQASNLLTLEEKNMLAEYSPEGVEEIQEMYRDSKQPIKWTGNLVTASGITVNTAELKEMGLEPPKTYEDLLDPKYKGLIAMPHPASSGTGYLQVSTWLQMMGKEKGWQYMKDLHKNVGVYTHSGSKPIKMAANGEFPISLGLVYSGIKEKQNGAPVEVYFPKKGLGWDVEANALINKKNNESDKLAKAFLDWAISNEAMKEYHQAYGLATKNENFETAKGFPKNFEDLLYKDHNLRQSAKHRSKILKQWEANFSGKAEPKK